MTRARLKTDHNHKASFLGSIYQLFRRVVSPTSPEKNRQPTTIAHSMNEGSLRSRSPQSEQFFSGSGLTIGFQPCSRRVHLSRYLSALFILALGAVFLLYVLFQARFLIAGPQLSLGSELSPIQHERTITLSGNAQNITAISINGRNIVTNEAGDWQEAIVLENGYTIVTIAARDRYGRETKLERPFVYVPFNSYAK